MTKEREILTFLHKEFFNPVLSSQWTTDELKNYTKDIMRAMNDRSAEGMIRYFWSVVAGEEIRTILTKRLEEEGVLEFTTIINEFKYHFNEEWLRNNDI